MRQNPVYIDSISSSTLQQRALAGYEMLANCCGCAWKCGVNRLQGERGKCQTGSRARVTGFGAHLGEERPLRGTRGSGTIFFSRCNLFCQYCQNHAISQKSTGDEVEPEELATIMLRLQEVGCHNINLVSPSHVVGQLLAAISIAAAAGLRLPIVYNTGGYDSLESLHLLNSIIDIYMPDMKYDNPHIAEKYSGIPDYPQVNRAAVKEMHRQVGNLWIDSDGLAVRGLLVRHLVLPNRLAGTEGIVKFLAQKISPKTFLNLMDQYRPEYKSHLLPEINRPINSAEFKEAVQMAQQAGLFRLN